MTDVVSRHSASSPVSTLSAGTDDTPNTVLEELNLNKEANEDELNQAIVRCKELILESQECSVDRKWLVRHLIELRFRLQEYKDAMSDPQHPKNKPDGVSSRTAKGHHFKLQSLLNNVGPKYCDHCTGTIWSVVQAWYVCDDCGYAVHYKCMVSIVRECAHVVACEKGQYELEICPEVGMSAQNYCCAECDTALILNKEWSDIRKCDYNGRYYCAACHWGSSAIIPARVVHNWDFDPYPVCQASFQILRVTSERPLMNLEQLNPKLFSRIQELGLVKRLRQELQGIRKYLIVCREAAHQHLLWKCEKPHWIENLDLYSLQDLVDTDSGDLPTKLHNLVDLYSKHIKQDCEICKGRGHICEICKNVEILYPFSINSFVCDHCGSVYHKHCIERKKLCPKCVRIKKRQSNEEFNNNE